MSLRKELVAASTVPLILSILAEQENYGYAIIHQVRDLSGGQMEWTDGMLYPVLHRLERQRLIRSRWRISDNGRKRKYYSILRSGRRALSEAREEWHVVHATLNRLWETNHVQPEHSH
jgi:DNA-binding PadR family transcriptional regulator